ncbi:MAG: radical SAM protein, partial [Novosphingobium sp.]|nr:radical SAM protein [Novosphingobium sp.]
MWPYYPDLLAVPVPRYTSFPTAAEFHERVGAAHFAEALEGVTGEISLYVHIPFCQQICWYCGCNTSVANRTQRVSSYLDALHREIVLVSERLPKAARVRRVAFGGGSPNAIAPVDLVRLVDALTIHFRLGDPVMSIELDPRSLSPQWEMVLGVIGFSHASLGVQTFSPKLQAAIGRLQPADSIGDATAMLRRAGVRSLNFDLIYGLPGQTIAELADTLDQAIGFGADRIAVFGYAHVPQQIPRQRQIEASALPDQQARFAMAAFGHRHLLGHGYLAVGFDHFARPGDPLAQAMISKRLRRNFQGFTDDDAPVLIGLGASAISMFPGLIVQNEKNAGRYRMKLSQDCLAASRGVLRSHDDRRRGEVIERLLCAGHAAMEPDLYAD